MCLLAVSTNLKGLLLAEVLSVYTMHTQVVAIAAQKPKRVIAVET